MIAGRPGWAYGDTLERIKAEPGVRYLGHVDDATLSALYSSAAVLAFPSLYEGFGLPLLEAMAHGLPAVVGNAGALPELADGAAIVVDSEDVRSIAAGIERLLSDARLREKLSAAGKERAAQFTWERAASATRDVLRRIASPEPRRRLVVRSPECQHRISVLAVLAGGDHDYVRMARPLLRSLEGTQHFNIDVATEPDRLAVEGRQVLLVASDHHLQAGQAELLTEFVRGGGGVVVLHGTLAKWVESGDVAELAGWAPTGPAPVTELVVRADQSHPLTQRLGPELKFTDELYLSEGPPVRRSGPAAHELALHRAGGGVRASGRRRAVRPHRSRASSVDLRGRVIPEAAAPHPVVCRGAVKRRRPSAWG